MSDHRNLILYIASFLFGSSIAYQAYILYTMLQAETLRKLFPGKVFLLKYDLNFIPLYIISALALSAVVWYLVRREMKSPANLLGCIVLILTIGLCYIQRKNGLVRFKF